MLPISPITTPLTIMLVGATGDLAKKKIWKALYQLFQQQLLPDSWQIMAVARSAYSREAFHEFIATIIQPSNKIRWQQFIKRVEYQSGDISDLKTFTSLAETCQNSTILGNRLWFLATLPSLYLPAIQHLQTSGLAVNPNGWSKLLLEKPFGTDLETAQLLNEQLASAFNEEQIYRIDHFLAKETVQNILVFRFANGIFEQLWDAKHIDHIEITASEQIGIAGRESFYDATGTLRDVVQNHVLQMLATTLMEEPLSLKAEQVREKRYELLSKLTIATPNTPADSVVFGQYRAGVVNGAEVKGYHQETGIPQSSVTETAVALKLLAHNQRWSGMPIYLKAGKRLDRSLTEIAIYFKEKSNRMFSSYRLTQTPNVLRFRIQPQESVGIEFSVKKPGLELAMHDVPFQFAYRDEFQTELVEAYVKLLHDAILSDSTLFAHAKDIEETWRVIDPLLKIKSKKINLYAAGTTGPAAFATLWEKK